MPEYVDVGPAVLEADAKATGALMAGGTILLCDGAMPGHGEPADEKLQLARLSFNAVEVKGTEITLTGLTGVARMPGKIRWFRMVGAAGETILQAPVGVRGLTVPAPLMVSRAEVNPGDKVDIARAVLQVTQRAH